MWEGHTEEVGDKLRNCRRREIEAAGVWGWESANLLPTISNSSQPCCLRETFMTKTRKAMMKEMMMTAATRGHFHVASQPPGKRSSRGGGTWAWREVRSEDTR